MPERQALDAEGVAIALDDTDDDLLARRHSSASPALGRAMASTVDDLSGHRL